MLDVNDNIRRVQERVWRSAERAGRDPESVKIVAVSKTFSPELIKLAYKAGLRDFGENYIQEALRKMEALSDLDINWHFVGHLQKNKAKFIPGRFVLLHSADSMELLEILERRCPGGKAVDLLIQVSFGTKFGVPEGEVLKFVNRILERGFRCLRFGGLMTIPPEPEKPEDSRPYFRRMRELKRELERSGLKVKELSMGMTDDFEVAVEEGATILRIGRAIFGPRE